MCNTDTYPLFEPRKHAAPHITHTHTHTQHSPEHATTHNISGMLSGYYKLPTGPRREGIGRKKANKKRLRNRDTHIHEDFHTHPFLNQCMGTSRLKAGVDGAMPRSKMVFRIFMKSKLWTRGSSKDCKEDTEKIYRRQKIVAGTLHTVLQKTKGYIFIAGHV